MSDTTPPPSEPPVVGEELVARCEVALGELDDFPFVERVLKDVTSALRSAVELKRDNEDAFATEAEMSESGDFYFLPDPTEGTEQ